MCKEELKVYVFFLHKITSFKLFLFLLKNPVCLNMQDNAEVQR